ncbi:MAG: ATP-binding cassette domain-containing protein [Gammaproteobacteria bacterium]|nr:ATP-binding cassette domain-containing protein [Gammaproteobacteria bacterium]
MSDPKLLEIRNATIWRGTTCVFDKLTLDIEQHERVAILGPNGSGKTTLLKTIDRELYPVAKADSYIRILGKDRWNVWQLRKRIGVVSNDLQQRYTASTPAVEVVVSGFHSSIGVHGILRDRVTPDQVAVAMETLSWLGLESLGKTPLQYMSSGQQRRCLLARALVHDPATLILDEPTSGLDFAASFDYLDRIRRLARDGRNIIIVTHHLNEIPPEVDRVILLQAGRVAADGAKAEILTEATLSAVYETPIRVAVVDGYYLAYPAGRGGHNSKT